MASQSMCNWMQRNSTGDDLGRDNPANLETNPRIQWLMGTCTEQEFRNYKRRSVEATGFPPSRCLNMNTCLWGNNLSSPSAHFAGIMYRQEPISEFDVPFLQRPSNFVVNMERSIHTCYENEPAIDFSPSHVAESQSHEVVRTRVREFDTLNLLGVHHEFDDETRNASSSLGRAVDNRTSMIDFFKKADTNTPNLVPMNTGGSCFSSVADVPPFDQSNRGSLSTGRQLLRGDGIIPEDSASVCNNGFGNRSSVGPLSNTNPGHCIMVGGEYAGPEKLDRRLLAESSVGPRGAVKAQKASNKRGSSSGGRGKELKKATRKAGGGSFPANVKSLLSTGIFDGLCVKYVSWDRKKSVKAVIKGPGYLCGCLDCKFSKVVNAYEMESHAGCKTKHPNGHIYFGNGKTVYEVVQQLKTKPEDQLLEAIRNVTGFGVNDANFDIWKASFLSANAELKSIYGGGGGGD